MSRSSPANFESGVVNLFTAVELSFDDQVVRLWNGYSDVTIDGDEYIGAGSLMTIGNVEESSEIAARGTTVVLMGLDASVISLALNEDYQNRPARVIVGTIDSGVFTTYTLFRGRMDVMEISESADTATIQISVENRLIDLERPRSARYTSEDQKTYYPNDLGLDYVTDLQDKTLNWGR